jgi:hypothetical protein
MKCDLGQEGVSKFYKRKVHEEYGGGGYELKVTLSDFDWTDCL